MSIASEISRLQSDSAAIASAIEAKGVTVPSGSGFDDYAGLIANISGGGGEDTFDNWRKDGDTHIWLDIWNEYQLTQTLRIRMIGTIDWGDGTTKDSVSVTSSTSFTHTYANLGKYRIDLHPTSGTFLVGNSSGSYNIMGARSNARSIIYYAVYQIEIGTSTITELTGSALGYMRGIKRLYIPKTITKIGKNQFCDDQGAEEIIFEDSTTITSGDLSSIFQNCLLLRNIIPFNPSGITSMGATYRSSSFLLDMMVPASITTMSAYAVGEICMRHLWCLPTTAPTASGTNAFSNIQSDAIFYVPYGSLSSYQGASYWSAYASQMVEAGKITYSLSHVERSNQTPMVAANSSYTTTLTAETGYTLGTVTVTMGGVNITSSVYSDGVVNIPSVTGNIVITATGTAS